MSDRLTEIVRNVYADPDSAAALLIVSAETKKALVGIAAPPEKDVWAIPTDTWRRLTAIPVVLDNATPPGVWRLLGRDGNEIERGKLSPEATGGTQ